MFAQWMIEKNGRPRQVAKASGISLALVNRFKKQLVDKLGLPPEGPRKSLPDSDE